MRVTVKRAIPIRRHHVFIERHPNGPRLYVFGQRVHHGTTGLALVGLAALARKPRLLAGAILMVHDRKDLRRWFARETLPELGADTLLTAKAAGLTLSNRSSG